MFSTFRNRLGIPGVISVIALVFAMLGGAYAANSSGGGKATASAKGKRGPTGPKGPKGAKGDTGPAGPQGPAGANGKDGAQGPKGDKGNDGTNGTSGTSGTNGKSVVSGVELPGVNCPEGGSNFQVEGSVSKTYACNGKTGFTKTLPPGETETGTYAALLAESGQALASITFAIPLPATIDQAHTIKLNTGDTVPTECSGGTVAQPKAAPGYLCIYNGPLSGANITGAFNPASELGVAVSVAGTGVKGEEIETPILPYFTGTYAVTACGSGFPCP